MFEEAEVLIESVSKKLWAEDFYITFSPVMKTREEAREALPIIP